MDSQDLNKEINTLREDVKLIMTNHLPHVQVKLVEHDWKLNLILWLTGTTAVVVIVALITSVLKLVMKS